MTLFLSGEGIYVVLARGWLRTVLTGAGVLPGCLPFQATLSQPPPVPHSGDKRR